MMSACSSPSSSGFVSAMTDYLDCQAEILGTSAWQALALPGSTLSVVLTGFLTIFIALIGYNLLLGHSLTVRSGTLAFVKIGAIFALSTSWPAYRTLVYDLVTDGPAQIVGEIGPAAGVVGADGTLRERLDGTDQALAQLAVLGPGNAMAAERPLPPFIGFDAFALGGSRILFLITAIGSLGVVRIVAGLMLALGPFFIAFLMFDATRSLFEGWVRVLAGAALAMIGVSIALGLQLALIEPWLGGVLARRMAGQAFPTVSVELFVITLLFAIIVLAALLASARVARAFRLPPVLQLLPVADAAAAQRVGAVPSTLPARVADTETERSRAAAVASMLVATSRRETDLRIATALAGPAPVGRVPDLDRGQDRTQRGVPVGRSFRRRATARTTASGNRRDAAQ